VNLRKDHYHTDPMINTPCGLYSSLIVIYMTL
jgi:hypothetical protein